MSDFQEEGKSLDEIFGMKQENCEEKRERAMEVLDVEEAPPTNANTDFEFARRNLYDVIQKSAKTLDTLMVVAAETEYPRAYEIVAALTNTVVQANEKLIKLHDDKIKLEERKNKQNQLPAPQGSISVEQAIIVGSTNDIQDLISLHKEKKKIEKQ